MHLVDKPPNSTAIDIAKTVEACKDGPGEYQEIWREAYSMQIAVKSELSEAQNPTSAFRTKGEKRANDIIFLTYNCKSVITELQELIDKHSSLQDEGNGKLKRLWSAYQVGSTGLDTIRSKLTFHTGAVNFFMLSLSVSTQSWIEKMVYYLYRVYRENEKRPLNQSDSASFISATSVAIMFSSGHGDDVWDMVKPELEDQGVAPAHLEGYKDKITENLKTMVEYRDPVHGREVGDLCGSASDIQLHVDLRRPRISSSVTPERSMIKTPLVHPVSGSGLVPPRITMVELLSIDDPKFVVAPRDDVVSLPTVNVWMICVDLELFREKKQPILGYSVKLTFGEQLAPWAVPHIIDVYPGRRHGIPLDYTPTEKPEPGSLLDIGGEETLRA